MKLNLISIMFLVFTLSICGCISVEDLPEIGEGRRAEISVPLAPKSPIPLSGKEIESRKKEVVIEKRK